MKLFFATGNPHKAVEIAELLGPGFEVADLSSLGSPPTWTEDGKTFEENAILKALTVSARTPEFVLADDSGLEVDALSGAPGIYSARYAGEPADDQRNCSKLVEELNRPEHINQPRTARFCCVLALARGGDLFKTFEGVVEGVIADSAAGHGGFGYDPLFIPDGFTQTFAELGPEIKNGISHRARALDQARAFLLKMAGHD